VKRVIVNGELLTQADVRSHAASLRSEREASGRQLDFEERVALQEEALQLLVDRLLMVQEARRLSFIPNEAEIDGVLGQWARRFDGVAGCRAGADNPESRDEIARRIMIDKLLTHWRSSARRPRLAELQNYYQSNKQQFYAPEMVHASHVVRHFEGVASREALHGAVETLRTRITAGEDFSNIAAQHSDCPENNGDLGWFARGIMVEEFDNAVFTAPAGELTPVFQTEFGFHFALIHARKAAAIRPFDEVRSTLEESLWLTNQDRQVGRALAALQAEAVIRSEA
jgi:peptidyl-prolyl cis-trans isomerase C